MYRIKELNIQNFKFFYQENPLKFDRKNVLIYGENGSGKSSIYWALYTFFQSAYKTDPLQVQKYFKPITVSEESLKNRFATDAEEAFIEISFEDDNKDLRRKIISAGTVNTLNDPLVKSITLSSDLIDYKSIFNIYNYTNKEKVTLFKYIEKNLLQFITLRTSLTRLDGITVSKSASDWWNYLKAGLDPYPKIKDPKYIEFQSLVEIFNTDFEFYLNSITETANEYLQSKFKEDITISFNYRKCTYNDFNKHNGGRNKKTIAPEVYLGVTLNNPNFNEYTRHVERAHTFLNEARLSSIALALRMAMLKEKFVAESPKFLVLDDLLLSLDMGNREAVLNIIIEEYFKDYQILFLTHDRVFFQTVLSYIKTFHGNALRSTGISDKEQIDSEYKIHWEVLEIYESSLPDNKIIPVVTHYKSHLQKALHYFSDANSLDYHACGNNLRAALEEFFREFLPAKFLKDANGNPIDKNSLTLNPLIVKCIDYFIHLGFSTEHLDKLNRYRERALNQTSHYNPTSNYFKRELQDTFEILNLLKKFKNDAIVKRDATLHFTISTANGVDYTYFFKPLDDIRLYKEAIDNATSFYCNTDKMSYGLIGCTNGTSSKVFKGSMNDLSLQEFYNSTLEKLESTSGESCVHSTDVYDTIKNIDGKSLNELKVY